MSQRLKVIAKFALDTMLIIISFYACWNLVQEKGVLPELYTMIPLFILIGMGVVLIGGFYECDDGEVGYHLISRLLISVGATYAVILVLSLSRVIFQIPLWVVFAAFIVSSYILMLYRIVIAGIRQAVWRTNGKYKSTRKRVIVMGAGVVGKFLCEHLNYDKTKNMEVVAFIDDNSELWGRRIRGVRVIGGRELIPHAVEKYNAQEIIIAIPHVSHSVIREIFDYCVTAECPVSRFANMSHFDARSLAKATIDKVDMEDLLGRDPIELDLERVETMLRGRVVLVTGGAGSIGSEICRQIMEFPIKKLVVYDISENGLFDLTNELNREHRGLFVTVMGSIQDESLLKQVFTEFKPRIVFHAAAHKHVPMVEANPLEAVQNNIFGSYNVMAAAISHHVENFITISTDKAVNPTNVMGATKRIVELLTLYMNEKNDTKFATVRFGNVLGSRGSVIPFFQQQLENGGPLTVTDRNIERYFMTIPEAVQLVMEAGTLVQKGEIAVLDMGRPVKIYELAENMIRLSGLQPGKDIEIQITGLRPGEKLYEELTGPDEEVTKTSNDRIFIIQTTKYDKAAFEQNLQNLRTAVAAVNRSEVLKELDKVTNYS